MPLTTGPNWLILLGLVYLAYSLGFLTASAFAGGGAGDDSSRRTMLAFAGGVGILGVLLQMLGQVATMGATGWTVLALLSLILVLLGYVVASDRAADAARTLGMAAHGDDSAPTSTAGVLSWRTAAE
jgi:hypothetical protein